MGELCGDVFSITGENSGGEVSDIYFYNKNNITVTDSALITIISNESKNNIAGMLNSGRSTALTALGSGYSNEDLSYWCSSNISNIPYLAGNNDEFCLLIGETESDKILSSVSVNNNIGGVKMYVVSYNSGKMNSISSFDVNVGIETYDINLSYKDDDTIKVYFWKNVLLPFTEPVIIK